jgi:hypothetical protein
LNGAAPVWRTGSTTCSLTTSSGLAELLEPVRARPQSTPWELAAHLTWSRPWPSYGRRMQIFDVTETDAHLRLLASRGLVGTDGGDVPSWTFNGG